MTSCVGVPVHLSVAGDVACISRAGHEWRREPLPPGSCLLVLFRGIACPTHGHQSPRLVSVSDECMFVRTKFVFLLFLLLLARWLCVHPGSGSHPLSMALWPPSRELVAQVLVSAVSDTGGDRCCRWLCWAAVLVPEH